MMDNGTAATVISHQNQIQSLCSNIYVIRLVEALLTSTVAPERLFKLCIPVSQ